MTQNFFSHKNEVGKSSSGEFMSLIEYEWFLKDKIGIKNIFVFSMNVYVNYENIYSRTNTIQSRIIIF